MHFLHLFAAISALTAVAAAPSSHRDGSDLQARSTHEKAARQPLNTYHAPHRFVDGTNSAAKRAFKKHRRGAETAPKSDKSQKRKVRKRSGKCVAKTSTASLSAAASATQSSSSASNNAAASSTAPTISLSTHVADSASSASTTSVPSSTLNVQNGAVLSTASPLSKAAPSSQSTSLAATSTLSSSAIPATTSSASSWTSVDTDGNGPFAGEITYYDLGSDGSAIGACGTSLVDSDKIAAASASLFDSWPGATGNPNTNPICGQYAKVSSGSASVIVQIQDRCPGCDERHLDLSPSAFLELAALSVGLMDVTWSWVETSSG